MVLVPYIDVLSAAFLMGLAAAAPMGPVNMLAIRRGVIGGWRHTLACGAGSIAGDLILFSLVLLGGDYLLLDLSNPMLRAVLAATGVTYIYFSFIAAVLIYGVYDSFGKTAMYVASPIILGSLYWMLPPN